MPACGATQLRASRRTGNVWVCVTNHSSRVKIPMNFYRAWAKMVPKSNACVRSRLWPERMPISNPLLIHQERVKP